MDFILFFKIINGFNLSETNLLQINLRLFIYGILKCLHFELYLFIFLLFFLVRWWQNNRPTPDW